jgi:hypothetical protein
VKWFDFEFHFITGETTSREVHVLLHSIRCGGHKNLLTHFLINMLVYSTVVWWSPSRAPAFFGRLCVVLGFFFAVAEIFLLVLIWRFLGFKRFSGGTHLEVLGIFATFSCTHLELIGVQAIFSCTHLVVFGLGFVVWEIQGFLFLSLIRKEDIFSLGWGVAFRGWWFVKRVSFKEKGFFPLCFSYCSCS